MAAELLEKKYLDIFNNLIANIRNGGYCVFIGSGLSIPANYPSWTQLLDRLKERAERASNKSIDDQNVNYYDRAENYKNILGKTDYEKFFQVEFEPGNNKQPWLPIHKDLVELNFDSYLTTNYDCLLEKAFIELGREVEYCYYPLFPLSKLRHHIIFHVHGVIDHENLANTRDSIILTSSDFNEAYRPDSSLIKLITTVYTELRIIFIGFNVRDEFMFKIIKHSNLEFEKTRNIVSSRGLGSLKSILHYAFLPNPTMKMVNSSEKMDTSIDLEKREFEDQELKSMGVNTIRYDGDEFNHTHLIKLIHEIKTSTTLIKDFFASQDETFRGG